MEATVETSKKQRGLQLASFSPKLETGWLYSTPVSKKAYSEPVREEFSPAKGIGNGSWIVRRWRDNINMSFQYETFPGYLHIELVGVITPVKEIKKLLEREGVLSGDDIDIFISGIRSAFYLFRPEIENDLKKDLGSRLVELHPLVAYLRVEPNVDLTESIEYFTDCVFSAKKEHLRDFVARHEDVLMTVKVVRKFKVYRGN